MKLKKVREPIDQSVAIRNNLPFISNWEEECRGRHEFTGEQMSYVAGMEEMTLAMKSEYLKAKTAEEFADNMKILIHERLKFYKEIIPHIP